MALRRVTLREHGAKELEDWLVKREVDRALAQTIVGELVEDGSIDDQRYTRVVARAQAMRGKGPRYIQAKMRRKGVRVELSRVSEIYGEVAEGSSAADAEFEAARRIVELRYAAAATDLKIKARAFRALLARGFSMQVARKAIG